MQTQVAKPLVFDLQGQIKESLNRAKAMLDDLEKDKDPFVRLAALAEFRHHLALATRAMEIATRADAIAEFQAGILEILAKASVSIRRKVIGLFEAQVQEI